MENEDRLTAPNNNELRILPQVEEIGNLTQKLYRLVSNIMEQPDDVKHVHSLITLLEQKIQELKKNTENYSVDVQMLQDTFDRSVPIEPTPIDDGKERVYWGPEDMAALKDQIIEEVVNRIAPVSPEEEIRKMEEYYDDTPDIEVSQVIDDPRDNPKPPAKRRRGGRSNRPTQMEKRPPRRGPDGKKKKAFDFTDTPE